MAELKAQRIVVEAGVIVVSILITFFLDAWRDRYQRAGDITVEWDAVSERGDPSVVRGSEPQASRAIGVMRAWRRLRPATLMCLVVCLGSAPALHGQVPATPGNTVRLTLAAGDGPPLHGVVSAADSNSWTITLADGSLLRVPSAEVALAEVRLYEGNTLKGALIGGGIGVVGGLLIVATGDDDCDRDFTGICDDIVHGAENAALVWAPLTGALVGALAGWLLVSERWVPAVHPAGAGGAVTLRWTLPLNR